MSTPHPRPHGPDGRSTATPRRRDARFLLHDRDTTFNMAFGCPTTISTEHAIRPDRPHRRHPLPWSAAGATATNSKPPDGAQVTPACGRSRTSRSSCGSFDSVSRVDFDRHAEADASACRRLSRKKQAVHRAATNRWKKLADGSPGELLLGRRRRGEIVAQPERRVPGSHGPHRRWEQHNFDAANAAINDTAASAGQAPVQPRRSGTARASHAEVHHDRHKADQHQPRAKPRRPMPISHDRQAPAAASAAQTIVTARIASTAKVEHRTNVVPLLPPGTESTEFKAAKAEAVEARPPCRHGRPASTRSSRPAARQRHDTSGSRSRGRRRTVRRTPGGRGQQWHGWAQPCAGCVDAIFPFLSGSLFPTKRRSLPRR